MPSAGPASLAGAFTWIDWTVVLVLLVFTHWVGKRSAGRPATMREFFLGGRKLPWYAVSGSIIATEISAVTLVSVPATVFNPGGNLTYLQLGLVGLFLARWIVALWLLPRYYEREIYSPYDYMGRRLGERVRGATTVLFSIGGVLGQASRVYLTGVVLEVILHEPFASFERATGVSGLVASIAVIGAVAVIWTWMGGMATVIWTDVVLFFVFLLAIAVALGVSLAHVDGGLAHALELGASAGKLQFLDFDTSPTKAYTIWVALFANTFVGVGVFGTDQLMAQRVFCCRSLRDAQKAMLASYASMIIAVLCALVGLALYAYYDQHPLGGAARALYAARPDRIFPIFVLEALPTGMKGLIIAGLFAAAISSLDSILAALAQTTLSAFWLPRERGGGELDAGGERRALALSKALVAVFGVLLCVIAVACEQIQKDARFASILDLALMMPGYTQGALLAAFALAFFPLRVDGSGFLWSAPLSVLTVFAIAWHEPWSAVVVRGAALLLGVLWSARVLAPAGERAASKALRSLVFAAALAVALLAQHGRWQVAWPWFTPIGCVSAFVWGYLLARRREEEAHP